jgi:hypothetical protein
MALKVGDELEALVAEHVFGWQTWLMTNGEVWRCDPSSERWLPRHGAVKTDRPHDRCDTSIEKYSTEGWWKVFVRGLMNTGSAAVFADMEDYGRGAITAGKADEVVTARIGEWQVTGPVGEAVCKAALLAIVAERK